MDIEACPGSGKTTLLVSKLAILARKWTSLRCGVCVLSHTNAARREIERHLGATSEGKRLLGYPHFVGTIHGFVNEFLAVPWLRSLEYPINVIDDGYCERHRRGLLNRAEFGALAKYVSGQESIDGVNVVANWRLASSVGQVLKLNGEAEFKNESKPAARQLVRLANKCLRDGYHRHVEMLMWADDLLAKYPRIREAIRARFPLLFLDEVQDNSEEQSRLLFKIFMEAGRPVLRQRFGDSNQAIYQNGKETKGAITDFFPNAAFRRDIPNSHRFGDEIGRLADPLALEPQGLLGQGPPRHRIRSETTGKHAVFLFDQDSVNRVIETYAEYLTTIFSEDDLRRGLFAAVGAVHRASKDDNAPRCVSCYWPSYRHQLTGSEPKPEKFLQYLAVGYSLAQASGEASHALDRVAAGLLHLVPLAEHSSRLVRRTPHRSVLERLVNQPDAASAYWECLRAFVVGRRLPSEREWTEEWASKVEGIVHALGGEQIGAQDLREFLAWEDVSEQISRIAASGKPANVFRYPAIDPIVEVHVGSIHSVKGETHTATLVLETYYKSHHLAALKPWLLGEKVGKGKEGVINKSRLKQHYVAMTRPTHLLCLAMKEATFSLEEISALARRGWRVARVTNDTPDWL